MMPVTILYFAHVRELVGLSSESVHLPPDIHTVADLADWLAKRSDGHAAAFVDPSRLRVALDQIMSCFDQPLDGALEIAFFPPVTGG
jgi:molybdopterin synthase sulfur carrier subunit